eukprot:CAMPEP_0198247916 /NCGR_PEP_ID=MMETSP1446-20131203/46717_1 /TAXON_ID=1461542 ORGANISM="Unidentified sp, Strain CCMP2111" /NCGR_SAMPLE_ID=MMETSP1446 /ASSEMBLY_ACC=CAM_ASM_001112 /LENGTH=120 /DNA_ID=CAMNT_0043932245 /DNA_START=351 /DNA_END=714 /DNA_ORIENTATION=+
MHGQTGDECGGLGPPVGAVVDAQPAKARSVLHVVGHATHEYPSWYPKSPESVGMPLASIVLVQFSTAPIVSSTTLQRVVSETLCVLASDATAASSRDISYKASFMSVLALASTASKKRVE